MQPVGINDIIAPFVETLRLIGEHIDVHVELAPELPLILAGG